MQNKVLAAAVPLILVAAVGGGVWFMNGGSLSNDSSGEASPSRTVFTNEPSPGAVVIEMTEEGFSPSELSVKMGDAVAWVNMSDRFRWPASNIHPTHELYPEFDPLEPVASGEVWEFTFNEVGTWTFHDHLIPRFTGTITVVE